MNMRKTIMALVLGALTTNLPAETLTWTGGYGGAYGPIWNNAANWGGTAYAQDSDIILAGSTQPNTYLGGSKSVSSITFANNAALFQISLFTKESIPGEAANLTFNSTNTGIIVMANNKYAQTIGTAYDTGVVILEGNLRVALNGSAPLYFLRPVTGPFGITKNGPGSLYLMSTNSYSGATTINAGLLVLASQSTGGGAVTVKDGATFGLDRDTAYTKHTRITPKLTISSLTLGSSAGAKIRFTLRDGNSAIPTLATDTLTLKGSNQVEIEGGNFAIGQFPLIQYTTLTGSGSFASAPAKLPWGVAATIVNNTGNKTIDLVVTAIPPNRSAAKTSMRIDEASDYRCYPDSFPTTKMDCDMLMTSVPVAQRVFGTAEACIAAPDNKTNDYSVARFMETAREMEANGWHISSAWIFREDAKHRPGSGEFEEDLRVLSATELANLRAGIANSALKSKDVKLIQLMGGNNVGGERKNWFELSAELRTHLLSFDGIATEMHVGDSDQGNEGTAARRLLLLQEMAAMTQWAKDNGKMALIFMGGNEATYSALKPTQHTYVSLWREMLRLGVNYRAENLIYVRQGAHADGDIGGLAGKHVPESDFDTLAHQQQWVIRALKDTSLFITANNSVSMTADTTKRMTVVGGKAERYPLYYSATSSDQTLVPNANLAVLGSNDGLDHSLSITPAPGQSGTATIQLSVSDGVDLRTQTIQLTVTPASFVTAVANGWINSSNTWGGTLPVAGDTQTWKTGARAINMSGKGADTFLGGTLEMQTGGSFSPGVPGASLTLNNLTMSGGLISMGNNIPLKINLQYNQLTLNGGTIRSGGSEGMDVYFESLIMGGSGTINITSAGTGASIVEFGDGVNTMGFNGIFNIINNGRLNLPHVLHDKASFGLDISGTGRYVNDAAVALRSLVLGGEVIPPGTYTYADFTPAQRAFIGNNGGTITVVASNTAPIISPIANQTVDEDEATAAIPFTVGDVETPATALTVTKASSNTNLVPVANIILGGTGINRTVTVTPAANQSGTATITLTVSDGILTNSTAFELEVLISNSDGDGDGMTNSSEIDAGRNPYSASDLAFEFNTGGTDGWYASANITNLSVVGGSITGTTVTFDPRLNREGFLFDSAAVPALIVKLKASAAGKLEFFWGNSVTPSFAAGRRIDVTYTATNAWQSLVIPIAGHSEWDGKTIVKLRIDPINVGGATFEIDWIRASGGDLDGDGIADIDEGFGDSDGDGLLDIEDPATPYQAWALGHAVLGSETDDDDQDGLPNRSEYALGGNPTNPADRGHVPTLGTRTTWLDYVHVQRSAPNSGVTYSVEVSDNLVSPDWTTNGVEIVGTGVLDAEFDTVTNRVSTETKTNQFIRLKIE